MIQPFLRLSLKILFSLTDQLLQPTNSSVDRETGMMGMRDTAMHSSIITVDQRSINIDYSIISLDLPIIPIDQSIIPLD